MERLGLAGKGVAAHSPLNKHGNSPEGPRLHRQGDHPMAQKTAGGVPGAITKKGGNKGGAGGRGGGGKGGSGDKGGSRGGK
jgi:hypothetical protein